MKKIYQTKSPRLFCPTFAKSKKESTILGKKSICMASQCHRIGQFFGKSLGSILLLCEFSLIFAGSTFVLWGSGSSISKKFEFESTKHLLLLFLLNFFYTFNSSLLSSATWWRAGSPMRGLAALSPSSPGSSPSALHPSGMAPICLKGSVQRE